jgi:outer membrane protein
MHPKSIRLPLLCLALASATLGFAQDTLTLDEALRLARLNNGDIRASLFDVRAAKARVNQSRSSFYPTITPFLEYNNRRSVTDSSGGNFISKNDGTTTGVDASWKVLDGGEREFSLLSSRRSEDAIKFDATQLLRRTLFSVHQQYYDALRAQELLRVAQSQVDRTQKIYDQAEFGSRPDIGSVAKKDVYQARADLLNAKVELLRVKSLTSTTLATLKATIGWDQKADIPLLAKVAEPTEFAQPDAKDKVIADGLRDRADLQAERKRVDAQYYSAKLADRQAGFSFDADLTYSRNFSPNRDDNRNLTLLVTYPLFDGGRLREIAREQKLNLQAAQATLVQSERQAQAEIESAYAEHVQNIERVQASKLALEAAQVNYDAAIAAQREGANDVIQVLTAQVSLVTAESNYIEATYDYYVTEANLRLVTGRPIPGETER